MTHQRETRFELARWVTEKGPRAKYNLGTSGIPGRMAGDYLPGRELGVGSAIFDGDVELREIIAKRYKRSVEEVALTASASEANFLVFFAFLSKGGTVVVESPSYQPLMRLGEMFDARIKWLDRRFDDRYSIDLESLKRLVKGSRLVVLTNLHNPSGVAIPPATLRAAAEIALDAGAWVLCDEIYRDFVPDTTTTAVDLGDNCIVTASLSKVYGFGGIKIGWTVATREMTERLQSVREMGSVCCSRLDEEVAKKVLTDRRLVREAISISRRNLPIVKRWVERSDRVEWVVPDGGILCFPRLKGVRDTMAFANRLFDEYGTLVSPGEYFGSSGHVRLCFGGSAEVIEGGLDAIDKALQKHKTRP